MSDQGQAVGLDWLLGMANRLDVLAPYRLVTRLIEAAFPRDETPRPP